MRYNNQDTADTQLLQISSVRYKGFELMSKNHGVDESMNSKYC